MRDDNHRRRLAGRAAAALAVVALPLWLAGPARAQIRMSATSGTGVQAASVSNQAPSLGGWNLTADGNAVDILIDNATGLAGIHPFTEAEFPAAQSQFQTGPFGSSMATVFWPGSAGGNFGSLSGELGFPDQLQPITSRLNDPVKASAQYPQGPASSSYPSGSSGGVAVMTAKAEAGGTSAEGAITDQAASTILHFSTAQGTSSTTAAKTAVARSQSEVSDVSLLGGVVDIGSVTGTAQAVSDGNTGTGSAFIHFSGLTVFGQKVTLGSDGLILPDYPGALGALTGPLVQNAISQVISGLGLTVTELPSSQTPNGAGFSATSGGIAITIDPPSGAAPILEQAAAQLAPFFPSQAAIIPTLPGLLQGMTITITLGHVTASADASPPFSMTFTPAPFAAPPAATGSSTGSFPVATGGGGATSTSGASPTLAGTGSVPSVASGTGGPSTPVSQSPVGSLSQPTTSLIALSKPLGAGPVVLGVLVTLLAGAGLWRLGRMLLPADVGPACPLGNDEP